MKKIILTFALLAGAVTFTATTSQAQVSVSFNIGRQPLWGPTGYDYAGYYYMPDVDAYYSIADQQFIYQDGGQWVFRSSLPGRYRNYDLYNGYKVVINDSRPWMRNDYYRRQYYGYRGRRGQGVIRDSRDSRYYEIANHPYHNQWRGGRMDREGDRGYRDGRRDGRRYDDRRRDGVDREGQRGDRGDRQWGDRNNAGDRSNRGDQQWGDRNNGADRNSGVDRNNGGDRTNGGDRSNGEGHGGRRR